MKFSSVLLSAGKGIRFGSAQPKQYLLLAGKPIIVHTLERLDNINEIEEIIIVCEEQYINTIREYLKQYLIKKKVIFALGGKTRQESVFNGIQIAKYNNIILHEAARPFVTIKDFKNLINCKEQNVTFSYKIPYSVLKKDKENWVTGILDREELINVQLPQKFIKSDLLKCHELARKEGRVFTEDAAMLVSCLNKPVYCLGGQAYNIKITESIDLLVGEMIFKEELEGGKDS